MSDARQTPFRAVVVRVSDGDSLIVMRDGATVRVRLAGIDCPEKGQGFFRPAKRLARLLVEGKEVQVHPWYVDRYGRLVAEVITPEGERLGMRLLREGYAWWYRLRHPDNVERREAEHAARARHLGLWQEPSPIAPWRWKRRRSEEQRRKHDPKR